jgi:hypothetical protein
VCNAIYSGTGRFYLFMLDSTRKQDLPKLVTYDLKDMCPKLDRYWVHLSQTQREE